MTLSLFCVAHKAPEVLLPEGIVTLGVNQFRESDYFTGVGQHINERNPRYSEVSAIYWLLNNPCPHFEEADFVGLCHYRRFFVVNNIQAASLPGSMSASPQEFKALRGACGVEAIEKLLLPGTCIAPQPVDFRRPLLQFYREKHLDAGQDLTLAYALATDQGLWTPEFADEQLNRETRLRPYCMSVMPRPEFLRIWGAITEVLLSIEGRVNHPDDPYQRRNLGFIAERMHSSTLAWLESQGRRVLNMPVVQVG